MTNAHNDEVIAEMIDIFGVQSYGVWWIILEIIALQMDKSDKCSVKYSIKKWSKTCGVSVKKFQKFASFLSKHGKISIKLCEKNSDFLEIECANLLKFRDEYSRKSGQTPDNIQTDSGQTPDQDTEAETETEADKKTAAPDPSKFKPKKDFVKWAESKGIEEDELPNYIEECLIWHGSKGNKYKDWNRTIQNWILKDLKQNPRSTHDYL